MDVEDFDAINEFIESQVDAAIILENDQYDLNGSYEESIYRDRILLLQQLQYQDFDSNDETQVTGSELNELISSFQQLNKHVHELFEDEKIFLQSNISEVVQTAEVDEISLDRTLIETDEFVEVDDDPIESEFISYEESLAFKFNELQSISPIISSFTKIDDDVIESPLTYQYSIVTDDSTDTHPDTLGAVDASENIEKMRLKSLKMLTSLQEEANQRKKLRHNSAKNIQRLFRGFSCRNSIFQSRRENACIVIQSYIRRRIAILQFKALYFQHREILKYKSCVIIQSFIRMVLCYRVYRQLLFDKRLFKAVIIIQKYYLRYRSRCKYLKLMNDTHFAIIIQSYVRRYIYYQRFKRLLKEYNSTIVCKNVSPSVKKISNLVRVNEISYKMMFHSWDLFHSSNLRLESYCLKLFEEKQPFVPFDLNVMSENQLFEVNEKDMLLIQDLGLSTDFRKCEVIELNVEGLTSIDFIFHFTCLMKLSLNVNKLYSIEGIQKLQYLQYLSLNDNKISNIQSLSELHYICYLYLDSNNITDISILGELQRLKILSCNNNRIIKLPQNTLWNQLEKLELSNNCIEVIDKIHVQEWKMLSYLNLSKNKIEFIDGKVISCCYMLQTLILSQNNLVSLPQPLYLPLLRNLWISGNQIQSLTSTCQDLITSNQINFCLFLPMLQRLFLQDNAISKIDPDFWMQFPQLIELDLSFNNLQSLESIHSLEYLNRFYSICSLQSINLIENPISSTTFKPNNWDLLSNNISETSWNIEIFLLDLCPSLTNICGNMISRDQQIDAYSRNYHIKSKHDIKRITRILIENNQYVKLIKSMIHLQNQFKKYEIDNKKLLIHSRSQNISYEYLCSNSVLTNLYWEELSRNLLLDIFHYISSKIVSIETIYLNAFGQQDLYNILIQHRGKWFNSFNVAIKSYYRESEVIQNKIRSKKKIQSLWRAYKTKKKFSDDLLKTKYVDSELDELLLQNNDIHLDIDDFDDTAFSRLDNQWVNLGPSVHSEKNNFIENPLEIQQSLVYGDHKRRKNIHVHDQISRPSSAVSNDSMMSSESVPSPKSNILESSKRLVCNSFVNSFCNYLYLCDIAYKIKMIGDLNCRLH